MIEGANPAISQSKDVVVVLRDAAQNLIDQRSIRDQDALLGHLVAAAVDLAPACFGGGLSRTHNRDVSTSHATTQSIYELDQLQSRLNEGPCVDAAERPPPEGYLLAADLGGRDGERWPRFAPYAVEVGVRSMLSTSVITERSRARIALNLYADRPDAFDDSDIVTMGLFANQAGAMLYGADHAQLLGAAIESRDLIGQAKGILMERFDLDDEEAFRMLVSSSQDINLKLVEVARFVVDEVRKRSRTKSS